MKNPLLTSRRDLCRKSIFGSAALVALRSLATGIPISYLLNPGRALADAAATSPTCTNPQYLILSTSVSGDPLNCNVPGTYLNSNIIHSADGNMAPTTMILGGRSYTAAAPWATLTGLNRTCFFHNKTNTDVHSDEATVLAVGNQLITSREALSSFFAAQLAPCLGTLQVQPISLSTATDEAVFFGGAPLAPLPPTAAVTALSAPTGGLASLSALRENTLAKLNAYHRTLTSPAGQKFIDNYTISRQQAQSISTSLLQSLSMVKDNSTVSQILVASVLVQLKLSPVITIHVPFGDDNHSDPGLGNEAAEHVSAVAALNLLATQLAPVANQVTFATWNIFGRTMANNAAAGSGVSIGRNHNANHHVMLMRGANVASSVIGGVEAFINDFGCTTIDPTTGASGGNIAVTDTMASAAKTLGSALGIPETTLNANILNGTLVKAGVVTVT